MHWITAFSHSTQAIRRSTCRSTPKLTFKQAHKRSWWALAEWSGDLLGLIGLTAWAVAWIGLMVYLVV